MAHYSYEKKLFSGIQAGQKTIFFKAVGSTRAVKLVGGKVNKRHRYKDK
jgi:hypothetical protein